MKKCDITPGLLGKLSAYLTAIKMLFEIYILKKARAKFLYLEVTHRCNLGCIACYTGAGREKDDVLTFEEQKSVVRQAKEMGARTVSLSGSGEPLLCKHLFALIDYIRELGMSVIVFTNGTLIDQAVATSLVARKVLTFFKLYSLDPDVFDRMVGRPNAYQWIDYQYTVDNLNRTQKIPSGLKALLDAQREAGCSNLIKAETLITKMNIHTLPDVAAFCKATGIGFFLETPVFKGKAIQNYQQVAVSASEYKILYQQLVAILGQEYLTTALNSSCSVEQNPVVWTDGSIGFCSSRQADIGNVRDQSLRELFVKAQKYKQKEDRLIARQAKKSFYFRTCPSRQCCEIKHNLPNDY
jgi:MoaA/NifB/PqqE/SkfB family radical SAM enzyme